MHQGRAARRAAGKLALQKRLHGQFGRSRGDVLRRTRNAVAGAERQPMPIGLLTLIAAALGPTTAGSCAVEEVALGEKGRPRRAVLVGQLPT